MFIVSKSQIRIQIDFRILFLAVLFYYNFWFLRKLIKRLSIEVALWLNYFVNKI